MKTIYLVTSGEYSDYRVVAAFSTEELANAFVASFVKFDSQVEGIPLDVSLPRDGHAGWMVQMDRLGTVHRCEATEPMIINDSDEMTTIWYRKNGFTTWLYAKDKEHAIKIAGERRTQLIATNKLESND